jgi:N-acetylglucosaminyl-diphospho-decaprenol L-rhamnosyltransferase
VPLVDVVIVSYNSRAHLRGCVELVAGLDDVHVIVVDNASTDGSLETIADLSITRLPLDQNKGFAYGCNVGWRRGDAPWVLFLNPDAKIDAPSLWRLVRVLEADEHVAAAAPRVVHPDGSLAFSLRRFPRLGSTYAQALFLHRLFPKAPWSGEVVRDEAVYTRQGSPDWVSGACILVRRPALDEIGGFDDGFFLYGEDVDLCRRLRDAGYDLRYEPMATCVHEGGASAPRSSLLSVLAASRARYARKHSRRLTSILERLGIALDALTHVLVTRGGWAARRGHARSLSAITRTLRSHGP